MDKRNELIKLKQELENIKNSIMKYEEEIEEAEYQALLLLSTEGVKSYLELLKNEDVQKYMNYHNQIGKYKKTIRDLADKQIELEYEVKQIDCKHNMILLYKVSNKFDNIKPAEYYYMCLECKKKFKGVYESYQGKKIIDKDYAINGDYELPMDRIEEIQMSYEHLKLDRNNTEKDVIKKIIKKYND